METFFDFLAKDFTFFYSFFTSSYLLILLASIALILVVQLYFSDNQSKSYPLPPSPFSLPILGHFHLLLYHASNPVAYFQQLAKKYGPIYHLKFFRSYLIVISDETLAKETLVKRGKKYAGRWPTKILMVPSEGGQDIALSPYNEHWQKLRRVASRFLTPAAITSMDKVQEHESLRLLRTLYESKEAWIDPMPYLLLLTCNVMVHKSFGFVFHSIHDPTFQRLCHAVYTMFELGAVANLEDYLDGWLAQALLKSKTEKMIREVCLPFHEHFVKHHLKKSERATECLANDLLKRKEEDDLTLNDMKHIIINFIAPGLDTTASSLAYLFAELTRHPELQASVYEQIRTQCPNALPTIDTPLPLVDASVRESLRLHPITPMIPRQTLEEDVLDGYRIPSGTHVIYDPTFGRSASAFCPEANPNETLYAFGLGRRICPGIHLAYRELVYIAARVLAAFEIRAPHALTMAMKPGLTAHPKEALRFRFTPRHGNVQGILEKEYLANHLEWGMQETVHTSIRA